MFQFLRDDRVGGFDGRSLEARVGGGRGGEDFRNAGALLRLWLLAP
jgi:hypothetical protein